MVDTMTAFLSSVAVFVGPLFGSPSVLSLASGNLVNHQEIVLWSIVDVPHTLSRCLTISVGVLPRIVSILRRISGLGSYLDLMYFVDPLSQMLTNQNQLYYIWAFLWIWVHTMRDTYSWCAMWECVRKIRQIWHIQFALMCQFTAQLANQMWRINEWHITQIRHIFSYTRCANHDAWRIANTNHASCGPSLKVPPTTPMCSNVCTADMLHARAHCALLL